MATGSSPAFRTARLADISSLTSFSRVTSSSAGLLLRHSLPRTTKYRPSGVSGYLSGKCYRLLLVASAIKRSVSRLDASASIWQSARSTSAPATSSSPQPAATARSANWWNASAIASWQFKKRLGWLLSIFGPGMCSIPEVIESTGPASRTAGMDLKLFRGLRVFPHNSGRST